MTSTQEKGKRHVKLGMKMYDLCGYLTWKPGNKAHFIAPGKAVSQSQDIFKVFDFIAIEPHRSIHFVQVTSGTKDSEGNAANRRAKIADLPWPTESAQARVMSFCSRGGYVMWFYEGDGDWKRLPPNLDLLKDARKALRGEPMGRVYDLFDINGREPSKDARKLRRGRY